MSNLPVAYGIQQNPSKFIQNAVLIFNLPNVRCTVVYTDFINRYSPELYAKIKQFIL